MDLGLQDKVAVVLASSKGLGLAAARSLAAEGCRLALCARGAEALAQAARSIWEEAGRPIFARSLDVEQREPMREFVKAVVKEFGTIHILVTNCGGPPPGLSLEMSDEQWDAAVRSTLLVSVDWTREIAPFMIRQRWGRIVHIASTSVKQPIDGLVLSNTMRSGVVGFAKTCSREFAPHGVLVNVVCPGLMDTDRLRALAEVRSRNAGVSAEEMLRRMTADIPLGRIGKTDEFASVIAFLASERASYLTGATIQVDGGAFRGMM